MLDKRSHDEKIKHLDYIQAIITRMSTASFSIKAASITICGAFIALSKNIDICNHNKKYLLILIPLFSFWYLDAYYLKRERCFRHLYDFVRISDNPQNFSMDINLYLQEECLCNALLTPPLSVLYISLIGSLYFFIF